MENVRDIMRNPQLVLNSLSRHSRDVNYKFERLYRILFNSEMFYVAYQKIYAKQGNMTQGADGKTIDDMSIERINQLVDSLKNETYQPFPSKRTYIPKRNGKMRPLGIPSFDDKLVQEVIRMILEAIYEGQFEHSSHGFRSERSCHTALSDIQKSFIGVKWFVEGDIKGFFDNINHDVMINILKERISDDRFIRLIRKLLNAGYLDKWIFNNTYSGTPQGGIVSPILANIYLDKLDKYVKRYIQSFNEGEKRSRTPEYRKLECRKRYITKKLETEENNDAKKAIIREIKKIDKSRILIPSQDEMDETFKRLKYVRYADDFILGVIGSKKECERVKEDIKQFLFNELQLELSDEKTLITHATKPAKFLGYEVYIRKSNQTKRDATGRPSRLFNNRIVLSITQETIRKKLIEYQAVWFKYIDGKEIWQPKGRPYLRNHDDLEILETYNAQIRGFYNYFSIANNSNIISDFSYIMEYSMYKTLAAKHNTSKAKILSQYMRNKDFAIPFTNKNGETKYRVFYNQGFKRKEPSRSHVFDQIPNTSIITNTRTSLIDRLKACKCEMCGAEENLQMHHIRRLKDLKGKERWEVLMIGRKRKTLAVCVGCHRKIHNGTQD
ncbi:group II intron reverse transcriptase/maturase [Chitinophaga terrae (ex Kim and Jung 2007)]|uniref:Group II intron reverse transcriptase/maturase n=2 Tax=Chitinophaga terrae (ex Kim and Jung 2007) TaxID=408074 RepID=A0A1H4EZ41_9BACT|nr:maturase [Chitinophaga terrae (ex Kim and Jung 2007)]SEA89930.1 group II intron reverse transcriptase/maturase [Chitinophaga terrae (ex Kim and Jung 2007)]